jgi:pimeloyl-ACP methyl ester carboxylesterase
MLRVTNESAPQEPEPHEPATASPRPHWPGRMLNLSIGQVFVRNGPAERGAEPALLTHGLGGASTNWTDLVDLLARPLERRPSAPLLASTAIDLPGFGCSPPPISGDYSVSAHATAIIEVIEELELGPVHLIGNSMGGAASTRVAARRPDLVRTLSLVSPALPDLRPRSLPIRLALASMPGIGPALMDWLRTVPADERTDRTLRDLFTDPTAMHPMRREEEIAEVLRRDDLMYASTALILSARAMVTEYFRVGRRSLWRDAAMTTAPALILHGSKDRLVNPVMAGKAARAFRSARVIVLPGLGHVAMMERPDLVATEIRAFLDWVHASGYSAGPPVLAAATRVPAARTSTPDDLPHERIRAKLAISGDGAPAGVQS